MEFEASELDKEGKGETLVGRFNYESLCLRIYHSHSSIYCEEDSSHFRVPLILPSRLPSTGSAECWQAFLTCCFGQFVERQGLRLVSKLSGGSSVPSPQGPKIRDSTDPRSSEIDSDTLEKNISDVKSKFIYALGMQKLSNSPEIHQWIETKKNVSGNNGVKNQDPLQQTEVMLTHLNLQETLMKPLGSVFPDMQRLAVVKLQYANIDASATAILCEGLQHTVCLDTLDLQYNRIGQGGAEAIGRMKTIWVQLSTFLLSNPTDDPIGPQGAIALFEPPHAEKQRSYLNSLSLVSLEGQMIGDRGVDGLVVAFAIMKKIASICLPRNEITESGADVLISNLHLTKRLRSLPVHGNVMSSDTETKLKQTLEKVLVSRQEIDSPMKLIKEQLRSKLSEGESQLKEAQRQREQLRKEIEAKESSNVALKTQNSELVKKISAETNQLSHLRQTKAGLQQELEKKDTEMRTLLSDRDSRISALQNDKIRATQKKKEFEEQLAIVKAKIIELEQEKSSIDSELETETSTLDRINNEIAELKRRCKDLMETIERQNAILQRKPLKDVQKLIAVLEGQVKSFDVDANEWHLLCALNRKINVDFGSSTFIATTTIFVCGGGTQPCTCHVDNCAYMLQADNGIVQELPHMSAERRYPGVTWDSDRKALYVFGGWVPGGTCYTGESLRTSEMFLSSEWSPLPEMHQGRQCFNPCWQSCLVYLCGGRTNSVETYDPRSNTFALQDFTLPESYETTAVVEGEVLTVVSDSYISKLQQGRLTSQQHEKYNPWSNCTPLVSEGAVYIVNLYNEYCHCMDLTTGAMRKTVELS